MSEAERMERRTNYIMKRVKDLVALGRSTWYLPQYRTNITDAEVLGVMLSKFLRWTPKEVIKACQSALEDSNLHELNAKLTALSFEG